MYQNGVRNGLTTNRDFNIGLGYTLWFFYCFMKSGSVPVLKLQEASIIEFETKEVQSKLKQVDWSGCARLLREKRAQRRPRRRKGAEGGPAESEILERESTIFTNSNNNNCLQLKGSGFLKSSSVLFLNKKTAGKLDFPDCLQSERIM